MKIRPRSKEDALREKIPTIQDVGTLYRPEGNQLMIVPLPDQEKTESGIILPDRSKTVFYEGHIVAVGPHANSRFDCGDCVNFNPSTGNLFQVDTDTKFWLVPDNQILLRIPVKELRQRQEAFDEERFSKTPIAIPNTDIRPVSQRRDK